VRNATICDTARELAGQQEGVVAVTDEMEIMDHRTQKHR
jgi:hypothetical protein